MQPDIPRSKPNGKMEAPLQTAANEAAVEAAVETAVETASGPPAKVEVSKDDLATVTMAEEAVVNHQKVLGARYAAWKADETVILDLIDKATKDLNMLVTTIGKKHGLFGGDGAGYHFDIKTGTFTRR